MTDKKIEYGEWEHGFSKLIEECSDGYVFDHDVWRDELYAYIHNNYTPNTEVQKAVEEAVEGFKKKILTASDTKTNELKSRGVDTRTLHALMKMSKIYDNYTFENLLDEVEKNGWIRIADARNIGVKAILTLKKVVKEYLESEGVKKHEKDDTKKGYMEIHNPKQFIKDLEGKEMRKVDKAFVRGKEQGRFDLALEIEWGQTTAKEEIARQIYTKQMEGVPSLSNIYRKLNKESEK
jgi:hypothetical protein